MAMRVNQDSARAFPCYQEDRFVLWVLVPGRAEICTWVALGFSVGGSVSQVGGENRLLLLILGWKGPECAMSALNTGVGLGTGDL